MTTTAPKLTLIPHGDPDATGKQKFKPVVSTLRAESQYNKQRIAEGKNPQYTITGLDEWWQWDLNKEPLTPGEKYRFFLTFKPIDAKRAFRDIVRAEPVVADAEGEFYDVSEPSDGEVPAPTSEEVVVPKPSEVSPLAGTSVPADWSHPIEYHLWKEAQARVSIEMQVAFKGLVELYGHMPEHNSDGSAFNIERLRVLAAIQDLAQRLGRFTFPDPDVLKEVERAEEDAA